VKKVIPDRTIHFETSDKLDNAVPLAIRTKTNY